MKIALLCPTKSRPSDVIRLIRSIESTVHRFSNIKLYLGVDSDDETQHEFDNCIRFKSYITKIVFPKHTKFPGLGVLWNYMASQATEDIFAMVGDDMVFETPDWDLKILKEFNVDNLPRNGIKMVHCNDGLHGPGNKYPDRYIQAVNSFIHRTYYDINGYYTRDELTHQYLDTWLDDVFKALKRKTYRHDIMIRHLHFSQTNKVDNVTRNLRRYSDPATIKNYYYNELAQAREEEITMLSNSQPISVSSVCTKSRIKEFMVMKNTLELFHECDWVIAVDTYCQEYFNDFNNVETITIVHSDGCHFGDRDAKDQFKVLMKTKMASMKRGIEKNGYSLFLDSDLVFLSALDKSFFNFLKDSNKTLFLTSHCIDNTFEDHILKYGVYNVGMLCSKDITFPDLWERETDRLNCSYGLEQKPVTIIAEASMDIVEVAPITYNFGWWRSKFSNHMDRLGLNNNGYLCVDNKKVVNIHAHHDPRIILPTTRNAEKKFFKKILEYITDRDVYCRVVSILNS